MRILVNVCRKDTNIEVGDCLHLLLFGDHMNDQGVAYKADQHDDSKEGGHQPGINQQRWSFPHRRCRVIAYRPVVCCITVRIATGY